MKKPNKTVGMRHVALCVKKFEQCTSFYTDLLGMLIDWQPDADNIYLSSDANDNLALHRAPSDFSPSTHQHLDHIGFFLEKYTDVDEWFTYLQSHDVIIKAAPKDHRDGTRSFYCADPDGNVVQMIYVPKK